MELLNRVKNDFRFSSSEVRDIAIAAFILGVTFSLRAWTQATIGDFIIGAIIALTSILFHVATQKVVGLKIGYKADFKLSWYGLGIALVFTVLYSGWFWWLIIPGGIKFSIFPKYRLGRMRYGINIFPMGLVAFSGAIGSIVYGTIFKNIELYLPWLGIEPGLLHAFFLFNLAYAAISLLPIPPLDGHYLFFGSRNAYVLMSTMVIIYTLLAAFEVYSWIIAIATGVLVLLLYYLKYEN